MKGMVRNPDIQKKRVKLPRNVKFRGSLTTCPGPVRGGGRCAHRPSRGHVPEPEGGSDPRVGGHRRGGRSRGTETTGSSPWGRGQGIPLVSVRTGGDRRPLRARRARRAGRSRSWCVWGPPCVSIFPLTSYTCQPTKIVFTATGHTTRHLTVEPQDAACGCRAKPLGGARCSSD